MENSVQIMNDLTDLPYDHNIKFASLDINNMYSNIPTKGMIATLERLCETSNLEDANKTRHFKNCTLQSGTNLLPLSGHDLRTKLKLSNGSSNFPYFLTNLPAKLREHQNRRTAAKTQS